MRHPAPDARHRPASWSDELSSGEELRLRAVELIVRAIAFATERWADEKAAAKVEDLLGAAPEPQPLLSFAAIVLLVLGSSLPRLWRRR